MRFRINIPKMAHFMKLKFRIYRLIWFWAFRFLLSSTLKTYLPKTDLLLGLNSLSIVFDYSSFYITLRHERNKSIRIKPLMTTWTHIINSEYLSNCLLFWILPPTNKNVVNYCFLWHNNFIVNLTYKSKFNKLKKMKNKYTVRIIVAFKYQDHL